MVAALSPSGLASLNSVIDMANSFAQQKDPGFDLRNNLIKNLGDDIVSYQKGPTGNSLAALANPPELFLVAVNNPEQVIQAVTVIAGMAAASTEPRDFLGHKIYAIALRPQQAANGTTVTPPAWNLASSGGYLAFSKDSGILEEYLRSGDGQSKPLRETASLADAAQHVGLGGGLFSYQNQRETMRTSFKLLKDASAADATMRMFPPTMREWLDFSLLPDYDAVAKYFYLSVFGGNANADGLNVKLYSPRPPQL